MSVTCFAPYFWQRCSGVGTDPLLFELLWCVPHMFRQHEVAMIEQAGHDLEIGNPAADHRSIRAFGGVSQQRALARLGCEEVIPVVEKQELEIRLEQTPCRLDQAGGGTDRRRSDHDRREVVDKPHIHGPAEQTVASSTHCRRRFRRLGFHASHESSRQDLLHNRQAENKKTQLERRVHPSFPLRPREGAATRRGTGPPLVLVSKTLTAGDGCHRRHQLLRVLPIRLNRNRDLLAGRDDRLSRLRHGLAVPHDIDSHVIDVLAAHRQFRTYEPALGAFQGHQLVLEIDLRVGGYVDVEICDGRANGVGAGVTTSVFCTV